MKTTHQLAAELLALPDVPVFCHGWCEIEGHEIRASITDYDKNLAIIHYPLVDDEIRERMKAHFDEHYEIVWIGGPSFTRDAQIR